jgi:hypothetical protein
MKMRIKKVLVVLGVMVAVIIAPFPSVNANVNFWEAGYQLLTCDFFGCGPSLESGIQGVIQVNTETVTNDGYEILAQWLSIDSIASCFGCDPHDWVQGGWVVGNLPDGTFTSTPVMYAESQVGSTYTFRQLVRLTFGQSYTFTVQLGPTNTSPSTVSLNGVIEYSVQYPAFYGQLAAAGEVHEGSTIISPDPSMNGHWSNLQFRFNSGDSWASFGSSDSNNLLPNHTQDLVLQNCGFNVVNAISVSEFILGSPLVCGGGVGGSNRHTFSPPDTRTSTRLIGPSSAGGGGAPQAPTRPNIFAYLSVLLPTIGAGSGLVLWWRLRRRQRVDWAKDTPPASTGG